MRSTARSRSCHRSLGRSPPAASWPSALELGHEEVLEAMEAGLAYDASRSRRRARRRRRRRRALTRTRSAARTTRYELAEYAATLAPELQALPARDRLVLHLRFVEDLTQSEIAERIGVSQMHVSRLIRRALERVRRNVGEGS